ncbi:MAG: hypothetical protein Q9207_003302 [Kuettlingeria erythrocarpa]
MSTNLTLQEKHPELFTESRDLQPRQRKRVVPMEVLSLGMARTGTASMQLALNILGFPCYHGITLIANLGDIEMWNAALDAKFFGTDDPFTREDWDLLLGNYGAVSDLPAVLFAEDLLRWYPDAKVVLVERDIERWFRSFDDGVIASIWNPVIRTIARLDSRFVGKLGSTSERWTAGWMEAHSKKEMQDKARGKCKEHYAMIKRVTPPGRLLIFKLEDGWEPLCSFLEKPIPNVEFPRVNESAALAEKIRLIARRGIRNAMVAYFKLVVPMIVLAIGLWAFRSDILLGWGHTS